MTDEAILIGIRISLFNLLYHARGGTSRPFLIYVFDIKTTHAVVAWAVVLLQSWAVKYDFLCLGWPLWHDAGADDVCQYPRATR